VTQHPYTYGAVEKAVRRRWWHRHAITILVACALCYLAAVRSVFLAERDSIPITAWVTADDVVKSANIAMVTTLAASVLSCIWVAMLRSPLASLIALRAYDQSRCPHCKYDLTNTNTKRLTLPCPECGWDP